MNKCRQDSVLAEEEVQEGKVRQACYDVLTTNQVYKDEFETQMRDVYDVAQAAAEQAAEQANNITQDLIKVAEDLENVVDKLTAADNETARAQAAIDKLKKNRTTVTNLGLLEMEKVHERANDRSSSKQWTSKMVLEFQASLDSSVSAKCDR